MLPKPKSAKRKQEEQQQEEEHQQQAEEQLRGGLRAGKRWAMQWQRWTAKQKQLQQQEQPEYDWHEPRELQFLRHLDALEHLPPLGGSSSSSSRG